MIYLQLKSLQTYDLEVLRERVIPFDIVDCLFGRFGGGGAVSVSMYSISLSSSTELVAAEACVDIEEPAEGSRFCCRKYRSTARSKLLLYVKSNLLASSSLEQPKDNHQLKLQEKKPTSEIFELQKKSVHSSQSIKVG